MMRQLHVADGPVLEWRDTQESAIEHGTDALVRPLAVAACDFDSAIMTARAPVPPSQVLGHECAGVVVDVGDEVTAVAPGDLVMVPFQISCGTCQRCVRGRTANCETVPPLSMFGFGAMGGEGWGGSFSDLQRVPFANHMLVPVPDGVTVAQAACVPDNFTNAWEVVAPALAETPDARVLVVGGGAWSMGVWAAQWAVVLGADEVVYLDDDAGRRDQAEHVGASAGELPDRRRFGAFDLVVDASGDPQLLAKALRSVAPDGRCESFGIYWNDPPLPLFEMYSKNATFRIARVHASGSLHEPLRHVAEGTIDPLLIATCCEWAEAVDALREPPTKLVVTRSS